MIKYIMEQMTITDWISIVMVVMAGLSGWYKMSSMFAKLSSKTEQQDAELEAQRLIIKKLEDKIDDNQNINRNKIEKITDKIDASSSTINTKLSGIEKDLVAAVGFLKGNVEFLSKISDDNKKRLDLHDTRFQNLDKDITNYFRK